MRWLQRLEQLALDLFVPKHAVGAPARAAPGRTRTAQSSASRRCLRAGPHAHVERGGSNDDAGDIEAPTATATSERSSRRTALAAGANAAAAAERPRLRRRRAAAGAVSAPRRRFGESGRESGAQADVEAGPTAAAATPPACRPRAAAAFAPATPYPALPPLKMPSAGHLSRQRSRSSYEAPSPGGTSFPDSPSSRSGGGDAAATAAVRDRSRRPRRRRRRPTGRAVERRRRPSCRRRRPISSPPPALLDEPSEEPSAGRKRPT